MEVGTYFVMGTFKLRRFHVLKKSALENLVLSAHSYQINGGFICLSILNKSPARTLGGRIRFR